MQYIIGMKSYSDGNAAATRYGFARFGLSSPDGAWTFGNDGVVNDDYPMPCSDEDSKDCPSSSGHPCQCTCQRRQWQC